MREVEVRFVRTKIEKLERRLEHQRRVGRTLDPGSILAVMNDRAVIEMEAKLFRLRNNPASLSSAACTTKGDYAVG